MNSVLCVCVGNICRSPMAEAILAAQLPTVSVKSAGIGALIGHGADPMAIELMAQRGLDISQHRARQIKDSFCRDANVVLVMDLEQKRFIEKTYPFSRGKVFCMLERSKIEVPDPYKKGLRAFELALNLIVEGGEEWAQRIKKLAINERHL